MKYFFPLFFLLLIVSCTKDQNLPVQVTLKQLDSSSKKLDFSVTTNFEKGEFTQVGVLYRFAPNIDLKNDYGYLKESEYGGFTYFNNAQLYTSHYLNFLIEDQPSAVQPISTDKFISGATYYAVGFAVVNGKLHLSEELEVKAPEDTNLKTGPAGGIVIYENEEGGGIELAPFYISTVDTLSDFPNFLSSYSWGCVDNFPASLSATSIDIGTGAANTSLILDACPSTYSAAQQCANLNYGGFSDWYLPSRNELLLASEIIASIEQFQLNTCWSSSMFFTSDNQGRPYYVDLRAGTSGSLENTWAQHFVIAARTF